MSCQEKDGPGESAVQRSLAPVEKKLDFVVRCTNDGLVRCSITLKGV